MKASYRESTESWKAQWKVRGLEPPKLMIAGGAAGARGAAGSVRREMREQTSRNQMFTEDKLTI